MIIRRDMIPITIIITGIILFSSITGLKAAGDLPLHGFGEYLTGTRVVDDPEERDDMLLNETRIQIEFSKTTDVAELQFRGDILHDDIGDSTSIDIREGYIVLLPTDIAEIKVGRQILTWGTGEYIFINDLFPKDWQSFFTGRDDAYLKLPSDAIRLSLFPEISDIDIVWTPIFTPDRFIRGERLSYFDPLTGSKAGDEGQVYAELPDREIDHSELALRIGRNIGGIELSIYSYRGFYKRPLAYDVVRDFNIFPRLAVYGASIRGEVIGGIGNIEIGYYASRDDRDGSHPFIENSDIKGLAAYSREIRQDLNLGIQYYIEYMMDYQAYKEGYPADPSTKRDRVRYLVTLSLTELLMMQTMRLSLFLFYSPSDEDIYIRPSMGYKWTDQIGISLGGNILAGKKIHTFFGQLDDNTNIYARIRYGF